MSSRVKATVEHVLAPNGSVYVNLVLTYIRPDGREFSLKLDPALAGDLIEAVKVVKDGAFVDKQKAIADTAVRRAEAARERLEEQTKAACDRLEGQVK